ncbi:MAG: cell division protein FtsZ, partial [Candidatus Hydrogenedentes bacterium]|nr:cell division protein FtsZ [Candidatus Hydrogenedentota bacterium]
MSLKLVEEGYSERRAFIEVVGVGGGGGNAIGRMIDCNLRGVEFVAINTDAQALTSCPAPQKVQIGGALTGGLGSGADPDIGRRAAEEDRDLIAEALRGADMVFVTAGLGGGTGTGGIPVVAEIARESGALTIAIVTRPFSFEGTRRTRVAEEGILQLCDKVDTLVIIPNDRLFTLCDQKTGVDGAFRLADEVLCHGVQAIAEVITVP